MPAQQWEDLLRKPAPQTHVSTEAVSACQLLRETVHLQPEKVAGDSEEEACHCVATAAGLLCRIVANSISLMVLTMSFYLPGLPMCCSCSRSKIRSCLSHLLPKRTPHETPIKVDNDLHRWTCPLRPSPFESSVELRRRVVAHQLKHME